MRTIFGAGVLSLGFLLLGSCGVGLGEPGVVEASTSVAGTNGATTTTGHAATSETTDVVVTGFVSTTTTGGGASSGGDGEDSAPGFLIHVDMPNAAGCDVWAQDCGRQQVCLPDAYWGDRFTCYLTSDTAEGSLEPCDDGPVSCQAGFLCYEPTLSSAQCNSRAYGCCTAFCRLSSPECPGVDQAPSEYADVGLCQVP